MSDAVQSVEDHAQLAAWNKTTARRKFLTVVIITLASGVVGHFYGELAYPEPAYAVDDDVWRGFRTGAMIGFISSAIETYYIRSVRQSWIRRAAFLPGILVRIVVITVIIRLVLMLNTMLSNVINDLPLMAQVVAGNQVRDTLISLGIVVAFVIVSQLSAIVGGKRFLNLVSGRYFRPVAEERLFLFVDLVGSSDAARRLGDVAFHEMLAEFFYHLDQSIVRQRGEVVSYVGDAVIVTWPLAGDRARNGRVLLAVKQMRLALLQQRPTFEKRFGFVPEFRAAIHGGPVVVGECGDSRRQVTFLGDTVNMTARIEAAGKTLEEPYLVSSAALGRLKLPAGMSAEAIGAVELKGAVEPMELHRVVFSA